MHVEAAGLFTVDALLREIEDGYVTARSHDTESLTIYNYSPKAQYANRWNPVTRACRGLILDDNYNIIARPYDKFFNYGDEANQIHLDPHFPIEVMDKADGSLGITYPLSDGTYAIATRGSFHSEQAQHATALWQERYSHTHIPEGLTVLFEIVYPQNRIVLDYGDTDDLILLGSRGVLSGLCLSPFDTQNILKWSGPVIETFEYTTLDTALQHMSRPNAEGYIVRQGSDFLKLKQTDYLEIHRIRFDMTPRRIWETLAEGGDIDGLIAQLPDEFHNEITTIRDDLRAQFADLQLDIMATYGRLMHIEDRKAFAQEALKTSRPSPLFSLKDGKDISDYIWKEIRP